MRTLLFPVATLTLALPACELLTPAALLEQPAKCEVDNHCLEEGGEFFCEAGFDWEDPSDSSNFTCVGVTNDDFRVPGGGDPDSGFSELAGTRDQSWAVLDINGDRFADLVVTAQRDDVDQLRPFGQGGGNPGVWRVFLGNGHRFSGTATEWALPAGGDVETGFAQMARSAFDTGDETWFTSDLNGDGAIDLVITSKRDNALTDHTFSGKWRVFLGGDGGFAAQAIEWNLPPGGDPDRGFFQVAGSSTSQPGAEGWSLADLTGDGKPDLVVHQETDPSGIRARVLGYDDGRAHWRVHTNTGRGFTE